MKKTVTLFSLALLGVLTLASCQQESTSTGGNSTPVSPSTPTFDFTEYVHFDDDVLNANVNKMLDGFRMQGTVVQRRYYPQLNTDQTYVYDDYGNMIPDTTIEIENNTYYTTVAYNGQDENAYYKYSYRVQSGIEIPAEGPYIYFEDENGHAYSEEVGYDNKITRVYDDSEYTSGSLNGYTFADNGFYNFFSILLESDFTLNTEITTYTRYDLNIHKVGIISNNLLSSLNSGATALPVQGSAYIRVDNGVFTSLNYELNAISSVDETTEEITLITNEVSFLFSDHGESTIEHTATAPETEHTATIEAAFAPFANDNYTMRVAHTYTSVLSGEATTDVKVYRFADEKIYVHAGSNDEQDLENDYYLSTRKDDESGLLYPFIYHSATSTWDEPTEEDAFTAFPSAYVGEFTFDDYAPIISDVSGSLFTESESTAFYTTYTANEEYVAMLAECFNITQLPLATTNMRSGLGNATGLSIQIDADGNLIGVSVAYSYTNNFEGTVYTGTVTTTYSNVGTTTLAI